MNNFYKHFVVLIGLAALSFFSFCAYGQADRNDIDSIKSNIQKLSTDTGKVSTLLERVNGFDCDDSLKKLLLANDAKQLAENIKWSQGVFKANRVLGHIYLQCEKNREKAFGYFQLNVDIARRNGDKIKEAIALETIAREYDLLHEQLKSIDYYYKVLALNPSVEIRANVLGQIGVTFSSIGDYSPALTYYDSSLNLFKSKKNLDRQDSNDIAVLYLNMGDLFLAKANPDKAFEQYQQVLNSVAGMTDKVLGVWGLLGTGKAYRMKKDYQLAIENYQKALLVCRVNNKFAEEVKIQDELASTYIETWELPKALAYADSALSLAETQHYLGILSRANATMGDVYIKQNKFDLAISYLQKALEIARQTNDLGDKKDAWESLDKVYRLSGQWELAYNSLENFKAISDTLYSIEKANEFTKNELNGEFKRKQFEDSLKTHIEFTEKLKRQRVLTYSGFVALVLVILLAFFMYRSYVTQKKYNDLLAVEKKRHLAHIEAQSNILSDIADTQAHKIRGPISTILGLVHIFNYDDLTDPMNKQVMEWITSTTEKLDATVKDVIIRENTLRTEHDESETENTT